MSQHDPFDPGQSREDARREALVGESQHAGDIARLMAEPWGRRLMWRWLEFGGVHRLSYAGPGQGEQTAFAEGTRNFALMLFASVMEHAPEQWPVMQQEAKKAEAEDAARKENAAKRTRWPLNLLR